MKILYNVVIEENDKLKKQKQELLEFINSVQVTLSHLLQDGDIMESGLTSAKDLLQSAEELQNKHRGKNEKY
jgi:hypothetical protein